MNLKELRVLAGGPLLTRENPTVQIDPSSSTVTATYLRDRNPASAEALAGADSWNVVDVQGGGVAASIDNKTFVGGWAKGRLVRIDKSGTATCQTSFSIAPPADMKVTVTTPSAGWATNDAMDLSAKQLRKQIDDTLGAP